MAQFNNEAENVKVHDQPLAPKPEIAVSDPAVGSALNSGEEKTGEPSSTQHKLESQQEPQTTDAGDKQHEELASGQEVTGESSNLTNQLQQNIEPEVVSGLDLTRTSTKLTARRIRPPERAETMILPMATKCKFDLIEQNSTKSAKRASFTASLSSSVINFKYENGRRYHAQDDKSKDLPSSRRIYLKLNCRRIFSSQ
jgi:hypothetical protein